MPSENIFMKEILIKILIIAYAVEGVVSVVA